MTQPDRTTHASAANPACDTSAEVQEAQLQLLREKTPAERLAMALRLSSEVTRLPKRAIARARPELTPREREHLFVELHHGKQLADGLREYDRTQRMDGSELASASS